MAAVVGRRSTPGLLPFLLQMGAQKKDEEFKKQQLQMMRDELANTRNQQERENKYKVASEFARLAIDKDPIAANLFINMLADDTVEGTQAEVSPITTAAGLGGVTQPVMPSSSAPNISGMSSQIQRQFLLDKLARLDDIREREKEVPTSAKPAWNLYKRQVRDASTPDVLLNLTEPAYEPIPTTEEIGAERYVYEKGARPTVEEAKELTGLTLAEKRLAPTYKVAEEEREEKKLTLEERRVAATEMDAASNRIIADASAAKAAKGETLTTAERLSITNQVKDLMREAPRNRLGGRSAETVNNLTRVWWEKVRGNYDPLVAAAFEKYLIKTGVLGVGTQGATGNLSDELETALYGE